MVISFSVNGYLLLFNLLLSRYYSVLNSFINRNKYWRSHGMEIIICNLTGNFISGKNLLQRRDITVKELLDFTVILVTEKVI